jgi:hypothetical protein
LIAHARIYILERMDRSQRRKCINYKIRDLPLRSGDSAEAEIGRRIFADIIKKANKEVKYAQKA